MNEQQKRELGARVQRLMDEKGFTNERLAYRAGVSSKTISRVINAKHELRLGTIEKLAEALEVSEVELRGPPPAPLGLGAQDDGTEARLEAIENRLEAIQATQLVLLAAIQEARKQTPARTTARRSSAS